MRIKVVNRYRLNHENIVRKIYRTNCSFGIKNISNNFWITNISIFALFCQKINCLDRVPFCKNIAKLVIIKNSGDGFGLWMLVLRFFNRLNVKNIPVVFVAGAVAVIVINGFLGVVVIVFVNGVVTRFSTAGHNAL